MGSELRQSQRRGFTSARGPVARIDWASFRTGIRFGYKKKGASIVERQSLKLFIAFQYHIKKLKKISVRLSI